MDLPFFIVDVFTETKYTGNQLAVIPDAGELSDLSMQEIAREMHFSETAFIRSSGIHDHAYDVRIYTPEHEVPFAGHPVLGTAYVIQTRIIQKPVAGIVINLTAGRIPVSFSYKNGSPMYIWMQQNPPVFTRTFHPSGIARVLSIPERAIDTVIR
jgi:trans-2,3-dihydro-3-hydroxyanthranilate isomerase